MSYHNMIISYNSYDIFNIFGIIINDISTIRRFTIMICSIMIYVYAVYIERREQRVRWYLLFTVCVRF